MDKNIKKINEILVNLFNTVLKLEEEAIRESEAKDLSITEIHTLAAIGKGRPKTMTHVANLLSISVSTLTTAVNKLVKKGYVERSRDEEDRRIVKIRLTEQGVSAVAAHEQFHEMMVGEAVADLPEEELQRFISSIDNINQFLIMRQAMAYEKREKFKLQPLQLGGHTVPIPIVSAGMSIGVAGSSLASAVAIEGGLGLIGTSEIGYREEGYRTDPAGTNLLVLEREIKEALAAVHKAKGKEKDKGLIGVSIMWNRPEAHRYAETAIKAGAQVIVTSGGLPTDLPKLAGSRKVALIPTISSKRAASAIIRTWSQKYNRVPDGFVYQGPLAAGLLGFREPQIEKAIQERYKIIAEIKAELMKLEHCPLIAGGGIIDRQDAEKAFRYGADGFLMGSRFVATEECDAPDTYKKLYLNCTENDVTIIRSPVKTSVRVMKNSFAEALSESGDDTYDLIGSVQKGAEGDYENSLIFCSANIGRINEIVSVRDVFREFTTEKDEGTPC